MGKKPDGKMRVAKGFGDVQIRADTFNDEERTVEIIWAAGAQVKRYSWEEGFYMEELSMDPKAIRLDRFKSGMSLLDSHDAFSMDNRLGTVVPKSVRIENGKAYATVKLSRKQRAEEIMQDLRDGHTFPVSVGYRTHAYEKKEGDGKQLPTLRAIDWEPMELSAVPVPADAGAHSRSENGEIYDCVVIRHDEETELESETADATRAASTMEKPMDKRAAAKKFTGDQLEALAIGFGITRSKDEDDEALRARLITVFDESDANERAAQEAETRRAAQDEAAKKPNKKPAPKASDVVDDDATRQVDVESVVAKERTRIADITAIGNKRDLSEEFVAKHIKAGTSIESFRAAAFDYLAEQSESDGVQSGGVSIPRGGQDERETRRAAIANAMLHRIGVAKELTEAAREWRSMSAMDIAKEVLRSQGESTRGSVNEIAKRALHSTSDFPIIMGEITNRTMLAGYEGYANTFGLISSRNVVPDFRELKTLELGSAPDLLPVNEHGEFKSGTMKESEESFKIGTYGRVIGFTRQMLINDQLDAFAKAISAWGSKAAKLEGDITWKVIIDNAKLKDGKALFHADHGNLASSGTALAIASLKVARKAFRAQKDIDGELISIAPTYLFVGSELEIDAQELVKSLFTANELSKTTPEFVKSLTVVYEPRIDQVGQYAWFLFAKPSDVNNRGLQHAYLSGQEAPFFDERLGFEVDGIEYKIRHDFGAGLTDYRFAYKNPGASS